MLASNNHRFISKHLDKNTYVFTFTVHSKHPKELKRSRNGQNQDFLAKFHKARNVSCFTSFLDFKN
jgi:hypothetical protein